MTAVQVGALAREGTGRREKLEIRFSHMASDAINHVYIMKPQ